MNLPEQKKFVRELSRTVTNDLLAALSRYKFTAWDGHELRCALADAFERSASMSTIRREPRRQRARDYKNLRLIHSDL